MSNPAVPTDRRALLQHALQSLDEMQAKLDAVEEARTEPIAIVGMSCRFPGGADSLEAYWELLCEGVDAVGELSQERQALVGGMDDLAGTSALKGGFLSDIDQFDPQFFGISPREATSMDPQQRLVLETSWEALERAGIAPDSLNGSLTGVFVGITTNDYGQLLRRDSSALDVYAATGSALNAAPGRVAYTLGLRGPSVAVDTACSSSLVAVHLAVQSLRNRECDMALAGGVNVTLLPEAFACFTAWGMLAPDGRCKAFDAAADGFVRGEGCGMVALKRQSDALADGDRILALVRGSAVNQDGRSAGLTVPNGTSQRAVIQVALRNARVDPAQVQYVEAHGTGTTLGDPIEIEAIGGALGAGRGPDTPLHLGSVKTNLGHLESAAGIAGLIKVVLMLQHGQIPPHLHFHQPSPDVPWPSFPIEISTSLTSWPDTDGPRLAGVSGFGLSGTNAHVVLESAPEPRPSTETESLPRHPLVLSARTEAALRSLAGHYAAHFEAHPDLKLADVAATTSQGRAHLPHRLALAPASIGEAAAALAAYAAGETGPGLVTGQAPLTSKPRPVVLFTGQGSQYAGMGRDLYAHSPVYRAALDRCAALLAPHLDRPLLEVLFAAPDTAEAALLDQTHYTQPALFAVEYALAALWQSWGIRPSAVAGHSLGEYVAACVAGVLSLEDALRLVAVRGRLMGSLPAGGAMAAIMAPVEPVRSAIERYGAALAIAAINGPAHTVISGEAGAVAAVSEVMVDAGIRVRPLTVSHAFHSALMDPMLDGLRAELESVTFHKPEIRLFTNLTGAGTTSEVASVDYWLRQTREPVQFAAAVEAMRERGFELFLEIGPHPVLSGMGRECAGGSAATWLPSLRRGRDEWTTILDSLGGLYVAGVEIDWSGVTSDYASGRVDLPLYPFQRKRYWFEATRRQSSTRSRADDAVHPLLGSRLRSALREVQYEQEMMPGDFGYLNDHRVFERAILPAAAFAEIGLAAANANQLETLHDLVIQAPLAFMDDETRIVQTVVSPEGDLAELRVYSRGVDGDDWTLHATARLGECADHDSLQPVDLDEVRERCQEAIAAETHYARLRESGIELGPALQGVRQLWRGDGEALAEIALVADEAGEVAGYHVHPALLDAAFQTLAVAVPDASGAFLPIGLEQARLLASPGASGSCHARIRQRVEPNGDGPRETLMADLTICDAEGHPLMELTGLALKRADQSVGEPLERLFYEIAWRSSPRSQSLPAPDRLAAQATDFLVAEPARRDDLQQYETLNEQLDELSSEYVLAALAQLGWNLQPGEQADLDALAARLGVADHNRRLLGRLLDILVEDGYLRSTSQGFVVERGWSVRDLAELEARRTALIDANGDFSAELTLLGRCGPDLSGVLAGTVDPLHLLFPDGDASDAEYLYTGSPVAMAYNGMVRAAVSEVVEAMPNRPLRVLEVGGGTGGTTAHLLPVLPADRTEYTFTDISPAFTAKAAGKFGAYPFVNYQPLDVERSPAEQGFTDGQYDIVLAVNVLHAVRDLRESLSYVRRLLAPGGLLFVVEVTAPYRWVDLTFGLTDGWWRFSDLDLRPDYPLISGAQWLDLLPELGFEAVDASAEGDLPVNQSLLIGRAPETSSVDLNGDWLIFADEDGVGHDLAGAVTGHGGRAILVQHGEVYARDADCFRIDSHAAADFTRLVSDAVPDIAKLAGVVYLWGLDTCAAGSVDELEAAESLAVGGALYAVQAVVASGGRPRFWLVTRGAQPAGEVSVEAAEQAALWGLGKVIALEHPELRATRVDLDPADERPATALLDEILNADDESEVALRGGERLVARLTRAVRDAKETTAVEDQPLELAIAARGTLDGLELRPTVRRSPGPGEVEIRVSATGLNFKDVMNVLGMYPGDPGPLGGECAGTVVAVGPGVDQLRPGDEVIAVSGGSFRSYVTAPVEFVVKRPDRLTTAEAATTAIAYVTANFALEHLGGMRAGERVLIHAAAGGVGMAAVHLALAAGAEVYATAGNPEKRAFLRDLGVKHVYDSRTLDFAGEILSDTGGEGVDLVLNSLSGEFVPRSLGLLRRNGRFLELGKRDHVSDEDIAALDRDVAYHLIDWSETAREDPALIAGVLRDVMTRVDDGRLPALPVRSFPFEEAADAFRYMARARHIGKVAVTYPATVDEGPIRSTGFYLITGGLRGLGLEVAGRLVERGARHLLLMGRSAPDVDALDAIARFASEGAQVLVHQGDVARQADVEAALAAIDSEGLPLLGVFHCAGLLDDGALTQQTWERFQRVMAPKVRGAWLLHELTIDRPIEHFVLFSSVAAVLGSPGQGNHSAANAYLDALAWQRRADGLPALSINWGAWSRVGAAAGDAVADRARQQGLDTISPELGLAALESLLRQSPSQAVVASVRWTAFLGRFTTPPAFFTELVPAVSRSSTAPPGGSPPSVNSVRDALASAPANRRQDILIDFVQGQAGLVLGLDAAQVGTLTPLSEYGLDSLMAVELRNRLGDGLGLSQPLPATLVFDYPSVEEIAGYLASSVLGLEGVEDAGAQSDAEAGAGNGALVAAMLDSLDALSDDEIDLLLADRASQRG